MDDLISIIGLIPIIQFMQSNLSANTIEFKSCQSELVEDGLIIINYAFKFSPPSTSSHALRGRQADRKVFLDYLLFTVGITLKIMMWLLIILVSLAFITLIVFLIENNTDLIYKQPNNFLLAFTKPCHTNTILNFSQHTLA